MVNSIRTTSNTPTATTPNREQAQTMLDMLAPDGKGLTFQTFDDNADRHSRAMIKQYHGTLSAHAQTLKTLNGKGAGVFITVNATDGMARKKENITAVRALYVDFDSADPKRLDMLLDLPLVPSMVIESSKDKHHAYWIADGIPLDNFTQWQNVLISYFDGLGDAPDKAVHDLPRVMRLAGFNHCKVNSKKGLTGEPFLTRIVYRGTRYSFDSVERFINHCMDSLPPQLMTEPTSKNTHNKQLSPPILAQIFNDSQSPNLSAERVRDLARGRWQDILGRLDYHVSSDIKEHGSCPVCGGTDRFRFDNENGTGSFICSQGDGNTIAGDGLSLLADHAGIGIQNAIQAVTAVLNDMGLLSPYDDKTQQASSGWGELGDISDSESKETHYPIEAWGEEGTILRDAVTATAYFSQIPLSMAGNCKLGALSTITQQYVNAPYSDSNDFMPVSLFLLTEMASGGGKSKTVSQFSHKELIKYQKERRQEYRTLKAEWEAEKASTPKKDLEAWLFQNPKPKQFILFAKSGTLIGFLDNMLMGNTTDVAWSTAEAALFLSSHSLTSETAKSNISQICDIWSGGEFDRLLSPRYNTIDEIGMDGVRFTLDLQGQPPIIAPALNDEVMSGQGLLPRFLFAFPDSLNGTLVFNTDERLDARPERDKRLQAYWQRCRELLDPSEGSLNKDEDDRIIRYNMPFESREARKALADYRTDREWSLRKGGSLEKYSEYAKRLHENASRIAAILAYFNGKRFISVDDIQRATKLTDFSMSERIRYTDKPQAGDNDAQKLIGWLVNYCNKQSVKQLAYSTAQSKVTPKALRFKPTFDLLIDVLESENYIKVKVNGRARIIQLRPELLAP